MAVQQPYWEGNPIKWRKFEICHTCFGRYIKRTNPMVNEHGFPLDFGPDIADLTPVALREKFKERW